MTFTCNKCYGGIIDLIWLLIKFWIVQSIMMRLVEAYLTRLYHERIIWGGDHRGWGKKCRICHAISKQEDTLCSNCLISHEELEVVKVPFKSDLVDRLDIFKKWFIYIQTYHLISRAYVFSYDNDSIGNLGRFFDIHDYMF